MVPYNLLTIFLLFDLLGLSAADPLLLGSGPVNGGDHVGRQLVLLFLDFESLPCGDHRHVVLFEGVAVGLALDWRPDHDLDVFLPLLGHCLAGD